MWNHAFQMSWYTCLSQSDKVEFHVPSLIFSTNIASHCTILGINSRLCITRMKNYCTKVESMGFLSSVKEKKSPLCIFINSIILALLLYIIRSLSEEKRTVHLEGVCWVLSEVKTHSFSYWCLVPSVDVDGLDFSQIERWEIADG